MDKEIAPTIYIYIWLGYAQASRDGNLIKPLLKKSFSLYTAVYFNFLFMATQATAASFAHLPPLHRNGRFRRLAVEGSGGSGGFGSRSDVVIAGC